MAKKRAPKKRAARASTGKDENNEIKVQGFIDNFNVQVETEITRYEETSEKLIEALKKEMHTTLLGIPDYIKKMTVQEYVEAYMENVNGPSQQKVEEEETSIPSDVVPQTKRRTRTARKTVNTKKVLKKTRKGSVSAQEKSVFQTPSSKPFRFKVVEGTPMLTIGGRRPNLLEKPRTLRNDDGISSIQLNLFSNRGSPVHFVGSQMSEEMRRTVAAAFQTMADELTK